MRTHPDVVGWPRRTFPVRPNPLLAEALRLVGRCERGKRREVARFLFDNLSYFRYWEDRGSREELRLALLALNGHNISRRGHVEPEAVFLVRIWAEDRLKAIRGDAPAALDESNERLLRQFVKRHLPAAEAQEIVLTDWSAL